jgi:hypothetical protein
MSKENATHLELLEQRIELLNSLSATLLAVRTAMTSFDIDSLESRIAQQQAICAEIRKLDEQTKRVQHQCAVHPGLRGGEETIANSPELEATVLRLHHAQDTVKQLNSAHQALVRRSHRTVTALLNSLHTFEGNYRKAALQQTLPAGQNDKV